MGLVSFVYPQLAHIQDAETIIFKIYVVLEMGGRT